MFPLALVVFCASGFAALLYQVIWQRLLAIFSGADVYSATIIVAAFMGGSVSGTSRAAMWPIACPGAPAWCCSAPPSSPSACSDCSADRCTTACCTTASEGSISDAARSR